RSPPRSDRSRRVAPSPVLAGPPPQPRGARKHAGTRAVRPTGCPASKLPQATMLSAVSGSSLEWQRPAGDLLFLRSLFYEELHSVKVWPHRDCLAVIAAVGESAML